MAGNVSRGKAALRGDLERRRRSLSPREVELHGETITARVLELDALDRGTWWGLYAAQPFEVPTRPLFERGTARGIHFAFPRLVPGSRRLSFHPVAAWDALAPSGKLGLNEPPADAPEVDHLDGFIVPGVGFTLSGARLGRGGGHYDATLAVHPRALRVGVTFECGLVEALPTEPTDVPVQVLITEARTVLILSPEGA